jgi:hypothetical protein
MCGQPNFRFGAACIAENSDINELLDHLKVENTRLEVNYFLGAIGIMAAQYE